MRRKARVRGAVDRTLGERGFEKVAEADADFLVTYYLGLETRIDDNLLAPLGGAFFMVGLIYVFF